MGLAFGKLAGVAGEDATALAALRKLPAADLVRGLNLMTMGPQRDTYSGPLRTDAKGALHATEIPFVFETVCFASAGPAAKADPWKARLDLLEKFASPLRPAGTRGPSPLPPRRP